MAYCPQSWDVFLEDMMMAGLERLSQSLGGKAEKAPETKMILTPAEAHQEDGDGRRRPESAGPPHHRRDPAVRTRP